MKLVFTLCIFTLLLLVTLGVKGLPLQDFQHITPFILNGDPAYKGEFPYLVAILENNIPLCGGSILDDKHILTAAHCLTSVSEAAKLSLRAGEHNISSSTDDGTEQVREFHHYVIHEDFRNGSGNNANDLAIIRLSIPLQFNEAVQPIRLPKRGQRPSGLAVVAGWGSTRLEANSEILQRLTVPIVSDDVCEESYKPWEKFFRFNPDIHFCAGFQQGGRDTCKGDSGGPLVAFDDGEYQAGIVSWGYGCGRPNMYGVYVRLSAYLDWIDSTIHAA